MGRFKNVNKNYNTLIQYLLTNQELCKLLYYKSEATDNPLDENPVGYADLYNKRIFKTNKIPTSDDGGCFLIVKLDDFRRSSNRVFRANTIICNLYVHQDDELISQGLRAYEILDRLDDMLGESLDFGIGKLEFLSCREYPKDDYPFTYYQLVYRDIGFSR